MAAPEPLDSREQPEELEQLEQVVPRVNKVHWDSQGHRELPEYRDLLAALVHWASWALREPRASKVTWATKELTEPRALPDSRARLVNQVQLELLVSPELLVTRETRDSKDYRVQLDHLELPVSLVTVEPPEGSDRLVRQVLRV